MTITKSIIQQAEKIISKKRRGIRYTPLHKAIKEKLPGVKDNTITPLEECSGSFSLSGIKVQSTQVEEDVRFETLFIPIPEGLFDQPLDFIV